MMKRNFLESIPRSRSSLGNYLKINVREHADENEIKIRDTAP